MTWVSVPVLLGGMVFPEGDNICSWKAYEGNTQIKPTHQFLTTRHTFGTAAWKTNSERGVVLELEAFKVMQTELGSAGFGREKEKTTFRPFFSKAVISGIATWESTATATENRM